MDAVTHGARAQDALVAPPGREQVELREALPRPVDAPVVPAGFGGRPQACRDPGLT